MSVSTSTVTTCQAASEDARLQEVMGKVYSVDLEPIKFKLMDDERGMGWTKERVDMVEDEYRKYLVLCALDPGTPCVPFGDIDRFWHFHILDTQKYAEDCQTIFERFLHHFPYLGMRGEEDKERLAKLGDVTKARWKRIFGGYRGGDVTKCSDDWCCGSLDMSSEAAREKIHLQRPTIS